MFHPDYPVVEGHHQLTENWSVNLPIKFSRRIDEEGSLVLWRSEPRITIFLDVWNNDQNETRRERLTRIKGIMSENTFDETLTEEEDRVLFTYRLNENESEDQRVAALHIFGISDTGQTSMVIYFDDEANLEVATSIATSLKVE